MQRRSGTVYSGMVRRSAMIGRAVIIFRPCSGIIATGVTVVAVLVIAFS